MASLLDRNNTPFTRVVQVDAILEFAAVDLRSILILRAINSTWSDAIHNYASSAWIGLAKMMARMGADPERTHSVALFDKIVKCRNPIGSSCAMDRLGFAVEALYTRGGALDEMQTLNKNASEKLDPARVLVMSVTESSSDQPSSLRLLLHLFDSLNAISLSSLDSQKLCSALLCTAAKRHHFETGKLLLETGAPPNPLGMVVMSEPQQKSVGGGKSVHVSREEGPIHALLSSCAFSDAAPDIISFIQLLVAKGCDINCRMEGGFLATPFISMIWNDTGLCHPFLHLFCQLPSLDLGARATRNTALTSLVDQQRNDTLRVILEAAGPGAYVNVPDANGEPPLHKACHFGRVESARLLLQYGHADVNLWSGRYVAPLPLAIWNSSGKVELVQLLLGHGAQAEGWGDKLGHASVVPVRGACGSARELAHARGFESIVRLLDHHAKRTKK